MTEKKRWVLSAIMSVMVTSGYAYADTAPNNQNGQAFYNQSAPGIPNSGAIYEAAPTPQQAVAPQAPQARRASGAMSSPAHPTHRS